jgi:hypothetical protein
MLAPKRNASVTHPAITRLEQKTRICGRLHRDWRHNPLLSMHAKQIAAQQIDCIKQLYFPVGLGSHVILWGQAMYIAIQEGRGMRSYQPDLWIGVLGRFTKIVKATFWTFPSILIINFVAQLLFQSYSKNRTLTSLAIASLMVASSMYWGKHCYTSFDPPKSSRNHRKIRDKVNVWPLPNIPEEVVNLSRLLSFFIHIFIWSSIRAGTEGWRTHNTST